MYFFTSLGEAGALLICSRGGKTAMENVAGSRRVYFEHPCGNLTEKNQKEILPLGDAEKKLIIKERHVFTVSHLRGWSLQYPYAFSYPSENSIRVDVRSAIRI
jgi:hypothetical protein